LGAKRSWQKQQLAWRALATIASGVLAAFLILPIVALFSTSLRDFGQGLRHPLVLPALGLSLFTTVTGLALIVAFGTPLAWLIARQQGRRLRLLETLLELPIVVPPAVAGIALLLAFGRHGLLSGLLYPRGSSLAFSTGAVIMAEVFVAAPFFLQSAVAAFRRLDPELLTVARTLGASPARVFWRVGLPLAAPGLVAGAALSWARALGEFGATLMFAGNLEGRTTTLPLAIYSALESDLRAAQALSLVLVVVAFALLLLIRGSLARRGLDREARS
jgi:molybdate transport system permease protein